ncbi:MAG: hypothetical protein ACR2PR_12340 [Pseudohongiellaceae bacterium]
MSKKKQQQNAKRGTYVLCITFGLIIGFGLGGAMDFLLPMIAIGGVAGSAAGYYFNQRSKNSTR